ncbi:sensor histidine kinase [Actinomyces capricornis]|uniref:histidine kinase n=1 Tax=Actinomyces capricornis TaxID=2755559 RepID=A0ABM7UBQ6_9ACTO|nr:histidine kinase [Actinomyces capricornis]BDA64714.1 two-component sensor histidine kinase [Actinomyces capricornis]
MTLLGRSSPLRNDVLLALGMALAQGAAVILLGSVSDPFPASFIRLGAGLLAAEGLALVLWRSRPLVCLALVWSIEVLLVLILPQGYVVHGYGPSVVAFAIGMRLPLRPATALLSALAIVEMAVMQWRSPADPWQGGAAVLLGSLGAYLLPMLGGAALASSRRYDTALRELVRREHARQLEVALIQERRRLAGELHDVAAHHLAGIAVQASAIERLIGRDPAAARSAAAQLRGQAKEALAGLRSVVGLLRRDHEDGAAPPGLADLPALIESISDVGADIRMRTDAQGPPPRLSPQEGAAVYRVAQQAISNALQHAPGARILVEVRRAGDRLILCVTNTAAQQEPSESGGGGTGLAVMRERAAAVGGQLEAGPSPQGGWRVRLALPLVQEEDA